MNHFTKGSVIKHQYGLLYESLRSTKITSLESTKTKNVDSKKNEVKAPLSNLGLTINKEAVGTMEPVNTEDSIENEYT